MNVCQTIRPIQLFTSMSCDKSLPFFWSLLNLSEPVQLGTISYFIRRLNDKTVRCPDLKIKSSFSTKRRQTQTESVKQSVCRIVGSTGGKMGKIKMFRQCLDLIGIRQQR